jgi:hypothetical protein
VKVIGKSTFLYIFLSLAVGLANKSPPRARGTSVGSMRQVTCCWCNGHGLQDS